jgi:hypothetical protein
LFLNIACRDIFAGNLDASMRAHPARIFRKTNAILQASACVNSCAAMDRTTA